MANDVEHQCSKEYGETGSLVGVQNTTALLENSSGVSL